MRAMSWMGCGNVLMAGAQEEALSTATVVEAEAVGVKVMAVRVSCLVSIPIMARGNTAKRDDFHQGVKKPARCGWETKRGGRKRLNDETPSGMERNLAKSVVWERDH